MTNHAEVRKRLSGWNPDKLMMQDRHRGCKRLVLKKSRYSFPVWITISGHVAIPTLISLIPLSVPLELKGALFDMLASFCELEPYPHMQVHFVPVPMPLMC
jgi:hypothetical protein